jgi:hypothetical protein
MNIQVTKRESYKKYHNDGTIAKYHRKLIATETKYP